MKYERKRINEYWLPIIGTGQVAWLKRNRPDVFAKLEAGQTIFNPLNPSTQYRLAQTTNEQKVRG